MPCLIQHKLSMGREQTVGSYIASLLETTGFEILITDGNSETVSDSLACNLTENEVIAFQLSCNHRRTPFALLRSEKGKGTTTTSPFTNRAKPRPPLA